ncbi:hypothetical protein BU24DRAFT_124082 [Aaosphaeria arxii CBS 175.79]|uniref:Uncharacterized protein n=1 Tax=Aaosphaeria arxii CBS 175.79 TaxID=1450172 RepID=A0A6A5Y526_9PLEO|nr:uncharacterized protein BU24DRAFT_124082 [Aaosphaeria arxii CBS 175.79]KAF2019634.1 hypothetical protein BU24DRAFT_124082 [Aaosphaeria arxii CBS 175.79]
MRIKKRRPFISNPCPVIEGCCWQGDAHSLQTDKPRKSFTIVQRRETYPTTGSFRNHGVKWYRLHPHPQSSSSGRYSIMMLILILYNIHSSHNPSSIPPSFAATLKLLDPKHHDSSTLWHLSTSPSPSHPEQSPQPQAHSRSHTNSSSSSPFPPPYTPHVNPAFLPPSPSFPQPSFLLQSSPSFYPFTSFSLAPTAED